MSHIYRHAVEFDIWLGEEEDESDLAMDLVEEYEKPVDVRQSLKVSETTLTYFLGRSETKQQIGLLIGGL